MPGGARASRRCGVGSKLLAALVQAAIDAVNAAFRCLPVEELDHDDRAVPATIKVRRKAIAAKYAELIAQICALPA